MNKKSKNYYILFGEEFLPRGIYTDWNLGQKAILDHDYSKHKEDCYKKCDSEKQCNDFMKEKGLKNLTIISNEEEFKVAKGRAYKLEKQLYYYDDNSIPNDEKPTPEKHKGYIGEAYNKVFELFKNYDFNKYKNNIDEIDLNNPFDIATKEIQKLSNANKQCTFSYDNANAVCFYNLMYAYAYAQHFNHIYRKLLEEIKNDGYMDNRESLTIASIGAGNFVDYWGLESALYMQKWEKDDINKIHYHAYEYMKWGENEEKQDVTMKKKIYDKREQGVFQICKRKIKLRVGEKRGNFFNIKDRAKDKADVVIFPSSFNELVTQQKNKENDSIATILRNISPQYIVITGHSSLEEYLCNIGNEEEMDEEYKRKIEDLKNYLENFEQFDKFEPIMKEKLLPSVMAWWKKGDNIINNNGEVLGLKKMLKDKKVDEDVIKKLGRFNPNTKVTNRVSHISYKVKK